MCTHCGVSAADGPGRGLTGNGSPASERGYLHVKFQFNDSMDRGA